MTDQERYELRRIQLDARERTANYGEGYPLTTALAQLAGANIKDGRLVTRVHITSRVNDTAYVMVEEFATDADGKVLIDPGCNAKSKWQHFTFDERRHAWQAEK